LTNERIHKQVIRDLNKAFERGDHDAIVALLDDTVVWDVPPHFTARGKAEFRTFITNPTADGPPVIELRNLVAEEDHVTLECYVENKFVGGGVFKARFHNAYVLKNSEMVKVKMTSYVVPTP
jgi:ketosteroid isomerase-like protein